MELAFYELDERIAAQAGRGIAEIFAAEGEAGFRGREREALEAVLRESPGVVALGGGALLDAHSQGVVEEHGPVVCLQASFEALLERAVRQGAGEQRPLLRGDPAERLRALLAQRAGHYASFPLQLDVDGLSIEQAAWQAQIMLGMFRIRGMGSMWLGSGYDVRVAPGGLAHLGAALQARGLKGPLALVTDTHVRPLHAERACRSLEAAGYAVRVLTIPAGEAYKTIDTLQSLWAGFLEAGLERGSTVVALGGGVVGDLAGFAASAYLRGVRWVGVPTSLLSMVDASLGGKTGADLPQGKNLVGAFHPPSLVLSDPDLLATLPEAELRNGLAEVVKHGILADPALFDLCSQGWAALQGRWDEVVRRAIAVKAAVIEEDPYEAGRRASLNLGHTLGHAIELASDFRLKHGEAVAIGTVAAARLSERLGLAQSGLAGQIEAALRGLGLPVQTPSWLERGRILAAMGHDKKRAGGKVRFVLPVRIGEARWGVEVEELSAIMIE